MSDLQILFPNTTTVTVNGVTAEVRAIQLRNVQHLAAVAAPIIALFAQYSVAGMASFCASFEKEINTLLTGQTSLTEGQISSLSANEAVIWCYQVVWCNASFFAEALPAIVASLPAGAESYSDS